MNCKAIYGSVQLMAVDQPKRVNDRAMFSTVSFDNNPMRFVIDDAKIIAVLGKKVQIESSLLRKTIRKIEKKMIAIMASKSLKWFSKKVPTSILEERFITCFVNNCPCFEMAENCESSEPVSSLVDNYCNLHVLVKGINYTQNYSNPEIIIEKIVPKPFFQLVQENVETPISSNEEVNSQTETKVVNQVEGEPTKEVEFESDQNVKKDNELEGDEPEGNEVEGDEVEGNEVEGDEVEGDEVDEGDEIEGDEVEGDELEGDEG